MDPTQRRYLDTRQAARLSRPQPEHAQPHAGERRRAALLQGQASGALRPGRPRPLDGGAQAALHGRVGGTGEGRGIGIGAGANFFSRSHGISPDRGRCPEMAGDY